ncbi:myb-related protein 2-like [Cocos nucifera]|uniref:Myb-related protein 2-like n=1 Tax=Cocos nucifera TaxID=13894 RepID=A0A8K0IRU1_COCNU|nr:myb-related protein 2-like [Cocos nucifera]
MSIHQQEMYHQHQRKNDLFSSRAAFPPERHLFLQRGNAPGNSGLILSTDAKPRLKWTPELHQRFIEAVNQLGGADITGSMIAADRASEVSGPLMDNTNIVSHSNKTMQISKALQMNIEAQKQLHEQLEVQRHLQLRIEAQGKYLQSVLEKAQETLGKQSMGSVGLEAAKVQLSELVSKVSKECFGTAFPSLKESSSLHTLQGQTTQFADYSGDGCLISCEEFQKDQETHNVCVGLRTCPGNSTLCTQQIGKDSTLEQIRFAWGGNMNEHSLLHSSTVKKSEMSIFPVDGESNIISKNIEVQEENGCSISISEARRKGIDGDDSYLELPDCKREAVKQGRNQLNEIALPCLTSQLDLNSHDDNDPPPGCRQFDLNGFSWS